MILKLRLKDGSTLPVRAHRILAKKFPLIKLYVHYGVIEGDNHYSKGIYSISDPNGLSLPTYIGKSLREVIEDSSAKIVYLGQDKVAERIKEKAAEFERMV